METNDKFEVSKGNVEVLKTLMEMMEYPFWRHQLRALVFEFKQTPNKIE